MLPWSAGAPGLPEHFVTRQCCLAFSGVREHFWAKEGHKQEE